MRAVSNRIRRWSKGFDPHWDKVVLLARPADRSAPDSIYCDFSKYKRVPNAGGVGSIPSAGSLNGVNSPTRFFRNWFYCYSNPAPPDTHFRFADAAELRFGTGDFTIEALVYPDSEVSQSRNIASKGDGTTNTGWQLFLNPDGSTASFLYGSTTLACNITGAKKMLDTGVLLQVKRQGTLLTMTVYVLVDASVARYVWDKYTATATTSYNFNQTNSLFLFRRRLGDNVNSFFGRVAAVRITNGVARPDLGTNPMPAILFPEH